MNQEYARIADRFGEIGIIPVIKLSSPGQALPLADALLDAGLPAAEITFRSDAAAEAIRRIRRDRPDMLCGAGTVLSREQVDAARDAGAQFVVAPGFNPTVVDYCIDLGMPVYPGVNNPMGIEFALERGLSILKFFPAEASGGIPMIKAISAPYGDVRFIATGGIGPGNILSYLASDAVIACGGSWIVKPSLIEAEAFDEIRDLSAEAVSLIREGRRS
jgi:2-dehydro-3-deoxyphosphogluconate aldolase/(4S)-4-hydroxy-2-oxoglutarate aldolase